MRSSLLALGFGLCQTFSQTASLGFALSDSDGHSLHGKIVKDALSATLDQSNLDLVVRSLDQKAEERAPEKYTKSGATEEQKFGQQLFNQRSFKSSIAFVDREQKKVLNYAAEADVSPASRYHALKHFGQLLLVVQDFYSRSNYVEIASQRMADKFGKTGFDPYNIELIDWNTLVSASKQNQPLAFGPATEAKETTSQGKAPLGSTTYFKTARELAVRETSRQWEVLETLIKHRYHDRAILILTALKQASCPATEPESLD